MNVLFVIRGNEPYVSQQAQIELMVGLQKKGVHIQLIGEASKDVKSHLLELEIPYQPLFPKNKIDRNYIQQLKKFVVENKIDIVHFLDGKASRSGLIALKNVKVKIVIYFGSASLHWYDPTSYLTYLNTRVDKIICNSQFVYDHVKKQLFGKNKNKPVKIYKGYNPEWFNSIAPFDFSEVNIPKDAIKVAYVGNHRKVKGTKYFLESSYHLTSTKEIHFIVIGERTNEGNLAEIARKSPIADRIHLLGKRNDVVSILKSTDIYAQTSLSEGFGRAISEAMSVENPVVMTNAGGCTELIDKETGIVVPLRDSKAIGKAISNLAENDSLRQEMGKLAKKRIQNMYHIQKTIEDTFNLYKELLID